MSAILFMLRKSLKNTILELLHHPAKLILYVFVIGILLFSGLSTLLDSPSINETFLDLRILEGAYVAILLLVMIPTLLTGLNSGTTIFTMSDVSMLFVSPISSRKILAYGIVKQMGTTLLIALFLLAYGGMAVNLFGITPAQALLLLLGFALTVLLTQLLTMVIYSLVNGNDARIRGVKTVLFVILAAELAYIGLSLYQNGLQPPVVYQAISSPVITWIPIAGWIKGLMFSAFAGEALYALLYGALLAVCAAACILTFLRSDADYYEDVLQNTESTYEMRKAVKEGRMVASKMSSRIPKVKDTGLHGGWGASAFFYKQMREMRRRSPVLFVNLSSLLVIVTGVAMGVIMQYSSSENHMPVNIIMMSILMLGVYLLFFLNAAGEWGKEIMKPYLYMVPESPLKKLLWASLTSLLKPAVDGLLLFGLAGLAVKAPVVTMIICYLIYVSFGFLFTTSNILSQRLLGQMANKGLILFLYFLMILVLVLPGLLLGLLLVFACNLPKVTMGVPVFVWNTIVSVGILLLCKNTLHDMEVL